MTSPASPSLPVLRQLLNEAKDGGWAGAELAFAAMSSLPALLDRLERQAAAIEAVQELAAKHYCSETSDGFGGFECGHCGDSWAHTLPGGEGCPTVRDLRTALSGITPTTEENPR